MLSTHSLLSAYAPSSSSSPTDLGRCSHPCNSHDDHPSAAGGRVIVGHPSADGGALSPPGGLSPSELVKRRLHERLMAGRAKTVSPAAEAPRRVMSPEVAAVVGRSTRPETDVESTHAHRDDCGLLSCPGSEEENRGSCLQGLCRGRTVVEMGDKGTRDIACSQECRGRDRAGGEATSHRRAVDETREATTVPSAVAVAEEVEAGCMDGRDRGRWTVWGSSGGAGCGLANSVPCSMDSSHLPVEESALRGGVVFSPTNTQHMSFPTSSGSGTTSLKRPNPFGFPSPDAVGHTSPKRIVFPFGSAGCDHLTAYVPGNVPLSSVTVEDAVNRLRITEQTARSRKKKSRRTPKVKKIKFHEYTGPNRRITAQKPKSSNAGTASNQPMVSNACDAGACKLTSSEVQVTQQLPEKQTQKSRNQPTTLNLNSAPPQHHQQQDRSTMLPFTEPLRSPKLYQQINPVPSVPLPFTTTVNSSVGLAVAPLQDQKAKTSICNIKLPLNTPPVAKAGTSAPLLVPIVVRRKEPASGCGSAANPNGVDRKASRRDTVVVENVMSLDDLKVTELKEECKKRKLSVTGPKPRLLNRLLPFADDILNERNLPTSSQAKSVVVQPPLRHSGDFKPDTTNSHSLPVRLSDFPGQQFVQTSTNPSDHLKTNPAVETPRHSSGIAGVTAYNTFPTTAVSNSLCNLNNTANCYSRPQLTDVSNSIVYPQKQKTWDRPTLSCYDFPPDDRDLYEDDVLLSFCKEMSQIHASKLKRNGTLSQDEQRPLMVGQAPVNLGSFHEASRAEPLSCKVQQQQFLTPPATPTLQTSGCVTHSPETSTRGIEIEPVNPPGLCPRLTSTVLRGIVGSKLCPKTMIPLTGAELWMLQEKQIAELHLQLQKSKAELSNARMKVCLQQQLSGDHLASGIAFRKTNDVLESLISLAQSQVSSRSETGALPATCVASGKTLEATTEKEADPGAVVSPHCDNRRGSESGSTVSEGEDLQVPVVVPDGAGDGGDFLLGEIPSQPETQGRAAVEELLLQNEKEYSKVPSTPDESSDTLIGSSSSSSSSSHLLPRPYFTTPAKEPPEYHEAMRQKLMLMQGVAASSAGESAESDSSEDHLLVGGPPSAAFSCSTSGSVKREEIEDVIEVLFGSADLAAADSHSSLPVSDRMWLDDVRAVIRDLVLSTPSYFKPLGIEPDSRETSTDHVTSQPEARWPTGRTETMESQVASGHQVTEGSCIGGEMGFVGLGEEAPWGMCNEGTPPSSSSEDLSDLPYVGFDWNDPSELGQPQFNWGSCPTSDEEEPTGSADQATSTSAAEMPPIVSRSCPGAFYPTSVPHLLCMSPPKGRVGETTNAEDFIPPELCGAEEGTTPVSPDANVDSSGDLLMTPAGPVQDLRWEGEWMDVFDGRRLTDSTMNLFPAFAFSP